MKSSSYKTIDRYIIYAITSKDEGGDDVAYIGKTCSSNLKRIWRYHRDGHSKLTADDFGKNACHTCPTFHILEVVESCTIALAYRHQIAWYRHADESGYITLSGEALDKAAYDMYPETQAIYDQISQKPFAAYLAQSHSSPVPPAVQSPEIPIPIKETQKTVQLNIRISEEEHAHFCEICNDNSLTQREAFAALLSNASETSAEQLIKQQRLTIEEHLRTIDALRREIKKTPRGANADIRLKTALSFCKEAINQYIKLILQETNDLPKAVKCKGWAQFVRSFPNARAYSYPTEDGFSVIRLDDLCYGHGKYSAIFIWGTDTETGNKIKVRYYPKHDYIGIPFPHSPLVCEGITLLIGYRPAPDSATDLYFAIPLVSQSLKFWSKTTGFAEEKKLSLDELIRRGQVSKNAKAEVL